MPDLFGKPTPDENIREQETNFLLEQLRKAATPALQRALNFTPAIGGGFSSKGAKGPLSGTDKLNTGQKSLPTSASKFFKGKINTLGKMFRKLNKATQEGGLTEAKKLLRRKTRN